MRGKAIYVLGYLNYEDKIDIDPHGNQKRRVTSFCQRIVQPTFVAVNSTANQAPTSTTNPASPAIIGRGAQPDVSKAIESQLTAQHPFFGVGCPDFNYCIDDDCPEMPKQ